MPAKRKTQKLTAREKLFVKEYLIDLNAARAAKSAGYSPSAARQLGYRLLTKDYIQLEIQKAKEKRAKKVEVTAEDVLREALLLMTSDITNYIVNKDGTLGVRDGVDPSVTRAVSSMKLKRKFDSNGKVIDEDMDIKLWSKPATLELVAKHIGMTPESLEKAIALKLSIVNDVDDDDTDIDTDPEDIDD